MCRFVEMSSRTAACGQPPVSTARMRSLQEFGVNLYFWEERVEGGGRHTLAVHCS